MLLPCRLIKLLGLNFPFRSICSDVFPFFLFFGYFVERGNRFLSRQISPNSKMDPGDEQLETFPFLSGESVNFYDFLFSPLSSFGEFVLFLLVASSM